MWREIIIIDMFHDLADISRDEYTWQPTPPSESLFRGHRDGLMAGNGGLNLVSYNDYVDHARTILFNLRYGIATTTAAEKRFRKWEIGFLRAYTPDVMKVQQFT